MEMADLPRFLLAISYQILSTDSVWFLLSVYLHRMLIGTVGRTECDSCGQSANTF